MINHNLKSKIFLDSGDPMETRDALKVLGFLDGQTTNPSLVAKNPQTAGKKFSQTEIYEFYRGVVRDISALIPNGSVSIEVYADSNTTAQQMLKQAHEFYQWIPNAHIKFPTTSEGLKAAEACAKEGIRVNMTLVFSQEQAAAVYAVTRGAKKGDVFLSPFVGRLDDRGEEGLDLIKNILEMYKQGDGHVEVLAASVRNQTHFIKALELGSDIITAPLKVLREWKETKNKFISESESKLTPIPYEQIDLNKNWQEYNIKHDLTDQGIKKFAEDWNKLISE